MRSTLIACGILAGTALAASPHAAAQERRALTAGERVRVAGGQAPALAAKMRVPMEAKIVKGAPYTAEVVNESIQTLADGNRIVHKSTGRVYRDGQGRVRREDDGAPGRPVHISIVDPVAKVSLSLDPGSKVAWKTPAGTAAVLASKIPLMVPPPPPPPPPGVDPSEVERSRRVEGEVIDAHKGAVVVPRSGVLMPTKRAAGAGPAWDERTERLAPRNIEGVMAEGTRITRTIPAGAIGNEQAIVTVTEEWRSPELQVLVMTRTSDPRMGESTYRLLGITRGEPDQSWFEVPAEYTVRESGVARLAPTVIDR
jgi:hypothetical protein